jgi:hypothetical protein
MPTGRTYAAAIARERMRARVDAAVAAATVASLLLG